MLPLGDFSAFESDNVRIYDFVVSGDFSASQREALERALNEWREALPEARLTVLGSGAKCDRPEVPDPRRKLVCVAPVSPDTMIVDAGADPNVIGLTRTNRYDDSAPILVTINVDVLTDEQQTACEAHEIGHAMGLQHTHKPGTLMYPSIDLGATHPTARDVADWRAVRR